MADGAICGTVVPESKMFTAVVGCESVARPPASPIRAASDRAQALRILHVFTPSLVWCIGQICPGSIPGQHLSLGSAAGTSLQQNASGAAAMLATWHTSQPQTIHARCRRAKDMDTSAYHGDSPV